MITQAEIFSAANSGCRVRISGRAIMPSDPMTQNYIGDSDDGIGARIYKIQRGPEIVTDCQRWDSMGRIIDSIEILVF